ncbi:MAG: GTP-binding protein [Candidatus Heimdallarchaeota archaeon]|nr:GTP-binding protein [Candidatus Heimdallarchaeota archaeon]HUU77979.1 Rab family GTPase [candidate division Zixibacteria bacterium]
MNAPEEEAFFKILIVGDGAVGKTSICTQITTKEFFSDYNLTVGCDFFIKRTFVNDIKVTMQIFDIGGQDQFAKLRSAFAGGAKGIFLAYDLTRRDSFYNLENWYNSIKDGLDPKAPKVLISTKYDLNDLAEIWKEDIDALIKALKIDAFFETSSITGEGINDALESMAHMLIARFEQDEYSKSAQRMKFIEGFYRGFSE